MTQTQENNVPALRFPEFSGEWEVDTITNRLSKVIDYRGKAPPKAETGTPLITARNVKMGHLDFEADEYIDAKQFDTWMTRGIPKPNDVLFTTEAPLGNVALFPSEGKHAVGQRIITLQTKAEKHSSIFLYQALLGPILQRRIDSRGTGSTAKGIKSKLFVKIPYAAPTLPEQQKIAVFLSSVDRKIAQLGQKKALLQDYKKGMMQKLFSQELRFKDAQGHDFPDWEEKRLGEVAEFSKGKGISKSDIDDDGLTSCVRYGQLYTHYAETISHVVSKTNVPIEQLVLSKENDVIIPASGETALDIATASCVTLCGVALGGDLNIIRSSLDGVFLAYYLNSDKKFEIARLAQGISVVHLYAGQLKTLMLSIPSQKEQQKIADFLSSIDRKINLISTELDHAKTFKKGLLQQMFI